jgi:hypothetical protein
MNKSRPWKAKKFVLRRKIFDNRRTYIAILRFALGTNALDEIQKQLARHGLNTAGQRLVMNVLREEIDSQGEVTKGQILSDMVHKISERAVCQRTANQLIRTC